MTTRRGEAIVDENDADDVDGALRRRSTSEDGRRGTDRGRGGVHFFLPIIGFVVVVVVVDDEDGDSEVDLRCSTPPPPPTGPPTPCIEGANSSSSSYALPSPSL